MQCIVILNYVKLNSSFCLSLNLYQYLKVIFRLLSKADDCYDVCTEKLRD